MKRKDQLCNPASGLLLSPMPHFKITRNPPILQKSQTIADPEFKRVELEIQPEAELPPVAIRHDEASITNIEDELVEPPSISITEEVLEPISGYRDAPPPQYGAPPPYQSGRFGDATPGRGGYGGGGRGDGRFGGPGHQPRPYTMMDDGGRGGYDDGRGPDRPYHRHDMPAGGRGYVGNNTNGGWNQPMNSGPSRPGDFRQNRGFRSPPISQFQQPMNRRFGGGGGGRGMGGHGHYQTPMQDYPDQYPNQGHRMRNQPEGYSRASPRYDDRQGAETGQVRPGFDSGPRNYGGDYRRAGPPFQHQHHHQGPPGRYDDQRPDMKRNANSAEFAPNKRQRSANRVGQQPQQQQLQTGGEETIQDGAQQPGHNAGNRRRSEPRRT